MLTVSALNLDCGTVWQIGYGDGIMSFGQQPAPAGKESCLLFLPSLVTKEVNRGRADVTPIPEFPVPFVVDGKSNGYLWLF